MSKTKYYKNLYKRIIDKFGHLMENDQDFQDVIVNRVMKVKILRGDIAKKQIKLRDYFLSKSLTIGDEEIDLLVDMNPGGKGKVTGQITEMMFIKTARLLFEDGIIDSYSTQVNNPHDVEGELSDLMIVYKGEEYHLMIQRDLHNGGAQSNRRGKYLNINKSSNGKVLLGVVTKKSSSVGNDYEENGIILPSELEGYLKNNG